MVISSCVYILWLYSGAENDDSDEDRGDDVRSKQLVEDYAKKLEKTEDGKSSDEDKTLSSGDEDSEDDEDTATDNDQRPSSTYALGQHLKRTVLLIVQCTIIFK